MATQYWVGDFFVDLTRNQITQKMQSQTIPPKALAVLTYLAKNANRVVSHDELLTEVWPHTVVTPNTLQRSITQLRKALGEDSQYQSYIKTHAKQGYSLECEVRWRDNTDSASFNNIQENALNETFDNESPVQEIINKISVGESIRKTSNYPVTQARFSRSILRLMSMLGGIVILAVVILASGGVSYLTPESPAKLSFK